MCSTAHLPMGESWREKVWNLAYRAVHSVVWLALAGILSGCCLGTDVLFKGSPTSVERPVPRATGYGQEQHSGFASEDGVQTMNTSDLVETVMSHPKMFEIFAFSSPQQGFNVVRERFDALSELLRRQDAGKAMLARYRGMSTEAGPSWSPDQVEEWLLSFQRLELILAQDEVLAQLDQVQLCALLNEARKKLEGKRRSEDLHGTTGEIATVRLMGRILQFAHWGDLDRVAAGNDDLRLFLDEGGFSFPGVVDEIATRSETVLSGRCTQE